MAAVVTERLAAVLLFILAWLGHQPTAARAEDTCYSYRKGFQSCWMGCCGSSGDQDCCSPTLFIVGVSLAVGAVLVLVVVLMLCCVCKNDCRPEKCCWQGSRGESRGSSSCSSDSGWRGRGAVVDRGGYHRRAGRGRRGILVVRPVEPPAYDVVSQMRSSSTLPGYATYRNQPASPPPAYTETAPASPPHTPDRPVRHARITTLDPGGVAGLTPPEAANRPLSVADIGQPTLRTFASSRNSSVRGASRNQVLQSVGEDGEMTVSPRQNSLNVNQMFRVQSFGDASGSSGGRHNAAPSEYVTQPRSFRSDEYV